MKTLEVVSKMAFLVFKKCKFPRIFCKMPTKTQFSEIILKIYLTKRKNVFEKLNHINFVTWAVTENPYFRGLGISLTRKKIEHLNFRSSLNFANWAEVLKYVPQNWGTSKNFEKNGQWNKNFHSQSVKNQRCSSLFQRKSALFSPESALFQRWYLALKIFVFSAVQSLISAVQRFSGNEKRWNRPEIVLNQSWSALNISETSTREAQPGILGEKAR